MRDEAQELVVKVLGSGSGLPDGTRDTTALLVGVAGRWTLVDCPGSVVHKLARCDLGVGDVQQVVLTHNHVDHVYGLPHLLHALAIAGEARPLRVHAPQQTLETVRGMVAAHGLDAAHHPRVEGRAIEMEEDFVVLEDGLRIVSSPAAHGRDTVALRFEGAGGAICHSSDTRPCDAVVRLARNAAFLLHDCGGPHRLRESFADSHSSSREAAETASAAAARRLVLMHLSGSEEELQECREEAAGIFSGAVELGTDGACYRVPAG